MRRGLLGGFAALCLAASLSPVATFASEVNLAEPAKPFLPMSVLDHEIVPLNNTDTKFEFEMKYHNSTSATGYRKKEDDTSVYINIRECRGRPQMFVDGAINDSGGRKRDCTAKLYRATVTGPHRMRNNVNEWGFSYARLASWNDLSDQAYVEGLWSPDSYRNANYPELPSY